MVEIIRLALGVSIIASCLGKINLVQPRNNIRPISTGLMLRDRDLQFAMLMVMIPQFGCGDHHTRFPDNLKPFKLVDSLVAG